LVPVIRLPQQKPALSCQGPMVRIHLPPAVSQVRTVIGPPELPVAPPKQAQAPSSTGGPRVRIHLPPAGRLRTRHRGSAINLRCHRSAVVARPTQRFGKTMPLALSCPITTNGSSGRHPEPTVEQYEKCAMVRVGARSHELHGLPRDRVRYHLRMGSWHGRNGRIRPTSSSGSPSKPAQS
jgi:hypothetical protein